VANLACVGVRAEAVVNCLNFGNPEHPAVMWQLSEAIDGMAEACNALSLPVIGGNVSLYNESGGVDIDPTPVVGLLGVLDSLLAPPPGWAFRDGDTLVLVGKREAAGALAFPLGGSRWATRRGRRGGVVAPLDAVAFLTAANFVRDEVANICAGNNSDVTAVHDIGSGGLALAVAEMVAVNAIGAVLQGIQSHAELFSELPGRFVVATNDVEAFQSRAKDQGVPVVVLGSVGGNNLVIDNWIDLSVVAIAERRRGALEEALVASGA
jgi:phosphoribosylformylglycinamidine synthase